MDEPSGRDRRPHRPGDAPWPRRSDRERSTQRRPAGGPIEEPTRPVAPWARRAPGRRAPGDLGPTTRLPVAGGRRVPPGARVAPDDSLTRPVPRTPDVDDAVTARNPRTPTPPVPDEAGPVEEPPVERTGRAPTPPPVRRTGRRRPRTLGRALLTTAAATAAPGAGHLMLNRRRSGALILGTFVLVVAALALAGLTLRRSDLLATLLSTRVLVLGALGCVLGAAAWIAVIVRTWVIAQPRGLDSGRRAVGIAAVTAMCLVVAAPLGFAANLANSQRSLLDELFNGGGGTSAAEAIGKPRLNLLLVGSDAGPDRTGTRTDTMMVASVDTATGRTTLFSLPRNVGYAQFPPGTPMAEEFPDGFHDADGAAPADFLLNGVYAYGNQFPDLAPPGPTDDPGLNLLHETVGHMLGLDLDYYIEVNMAGFASIIDALGGLQVDVGPERIPIGGITPSGRTVEPDRYLDPGPQQLSGEDALAFARSRTNSTDYVRMGRQRCLIQNILDQTSPAELVTNFQAVAGATTANVSTNIPQQVLPALLTIADGPLALESVSFDPNLPDPEESDGRFNTGDPNFPYMREVVRDAIARDPAAAPPVVAAAPSDIPETNESSADATADESESGSASPDPAPTADGAEVPLTTTPVSVARSC